MAHKNFRCKRCGYTFHDFSGRWLNKVQITAKDWLWILKLFELELSARRIADQVRLSYPTVLKAVTIIRKARISPTRDADALWAVKWEWMRVILVADERGNGE